MRLVDITCHVSYDKVNAMKHERDRCQQHGNSKFYTRNADFKNRDEYIGTKRNESKEVRKCLQSNIKSNKVRKSARISKHWLVARE